MNEGRVARLMLVSVAGLVLLPWAIAQQPGTGGGSDTKGGEATKTTSTTPTKTTVTTTKDTGAQERPKLQLLFVSGVVVMEDGSPVPSDAVIERSCHGRVTRETYVGAGGSYSFQVGGGNNRMNSMLPDASEDFHDATLSRIGRGLSSGDSSTTPTSLAGCEVRAQLPGYRSSRVILDGSHTMGRIDAGTIVLVRIEKMRGTLVSATDLGAPKPARKALERAQNAFRKQRLDEAEKHLKTAIKLYPQYAAAWVGLGEVYQAGQRFAEAREAFQRAIAADDRYVNPYISIARIAILEQKWQEAADLTDHALQLDPINFPEGYFFNALAHHNLNNLEAAEKSARKAQRLDPLHTIPQTFILLANILEQREDIAGASEQLQKYLMIAPQSTYAPQARLRLLRLLETSRPLAEKQ